MGTVRKQRNGLHQQTHEGKGTYSDIFRAEPGHGDAALYTTATSEHANISSVKGHANRAKLGASCADHQKYAQEQLMEGFKTLQCKQTLYNYSILSITFPEKAFSADVCVCNFCFFTIDHAAWMHAFTR